MDITLKIPIKIITKKIHPHKTNSIFYAGKNIACVHYGNREYTLTTAGEYSYTSKINGKKRYDEHSRIVKSWLTDSRIKKLSDENLMNNWGWYGINVWVDDQCMDTPTDCYSQYDEAMQAFVKYVTRDLQNYINK